MRSKHSGKMDLRIGIDARYLENRISGIERYTLNLLRGIAAAAPGFRVTVIVNNIGTVPEDLKKSTALELIEVPWFPRRPADQLALPAVIGRLGLKLLHHPDSFAPLMAPGQVVITVHDMIGITCRHLLPTSIKSR